MCRCWLGLGGQWAFATQDRAIKGGGSGVIGGDACSVGNISDAGVTEWNRAVLNPVVGTICLAGGDYLVEVEQIWHPKCATGARAVEVFAGSGINE